MKDSTAGRFLGYARERDFTNDHLSAISAALISIADSMERIERLIDARENGA